MGSNQCQNDNLWGLLPQSTNKFVSQYFYCIFLPVFSVVCVKEKDAWEKTEKNGREGNGLGKENKIFVVAKLFA